VIAPILEAKYYDEGVIDEGLCRGAAMNRILIVVFSSVLASAWPCGALAQGQQASGSALTKLMVLFSWSASRFAAPQHVVSPKKDWAIVKEVQDERTARVERERRLREARQRIVERERELRLAREAYRRETSRMVQAPESSSGIARADRAAQDARILMAERRLTEQEREAYQAKLEYSRAARAVREQRQRDAQAVEGDS